MTCVAGTKLLNDQPMRAVAPYPLAVVLPVEIAIELPLRSVYPIQIKKIGAIGKAPSAGNPDLRHQVRRVIPDDYLLTCSKCLLPMARPMSSF